MSDEEAEARAQRQSAALQEIFRRAHERTKYGRTIRVTKDVRLLVEDSRTRPGGSNMSEIPNEVKAALLVILNHVEPGWENCVAVLRHWLESIKQEEDK